MIEKSLATLDQEERLQVGALIHRYYKGAGPAFVKARTEATGPAYDVVLKKEGQKILAVSYYRLNKTLTPFSRKKIFLIQFGQALKHAGYKGNVIWKQGDWYARKKIGWLYPFRKVMGLTSIYNPKVLEQFIRLFPENYPYSSQKPELIPFINAYLQHHQQMDLQLDDSFCVMPPGLEEVEITEDWERYFKAKSEAINQFFIDRGIIRMENGRVYHTSRHLVACGYRSATTTFKALLKK